MKKLIFILFPLHFVYASVSNGPYFGLEAGVANEIVDYSSGSFNFNSNSVNLVNSVPTFLLRANLGYNFDKYNGFEIGGTHNFNASFANPGGNGDFRFDANTLDMSYILSLPVVVNNISVFGRVGFAYDWVSNTSSGCSCGITDNGLTGHGFADVLGAGIKYNLSPKLSWRIEWVSNGLLFPVSINSGNVSASWTNQTFQTGINYSF